MRPIPATPTAKPSLRGVLHLVSAFVAAIAGVWLVLQAPTARAAWDAGVFASSLVTLFGVSALYHVPHWQPGPRAILRRVDHAAIFVLIAGTYTPICDLVLGGAGGVGGIGPGLLRWVWVAAAAGVARDVLWPNAPKLLLVLPYLALGWVALWFGPALYQVVSPSVMIEIALGGLFYTLGALCYALRRPNPLPGVFGYHEMFHAFTILAAACHFVAATAVVLAAR